MDYVSHKTEYAIPRERYLTRWQTAAAQDRWCTAQIQGTSHTTKHILIQNSRQIVWETLTYWFAASPPPPTHNICIRLCSWCEEILQTKKKNPHTLIWPSGSGQTFSTWFQNLCHVDLSVAAGSASHGWLHVACDSATSLCVWKTQAHSLIPQSVLLQVHRLLQIEFSTQCDLVLLFQFPVPYRFVKVIQ